MYNRKHRAGRMIVFLASAVLTFAALTSSFGYKNIHSQMHHAHGCSTHQTPEVK